jgi:mRNA interferase RelE/StbE
VSAATQIYSRDFDADFFKLPPNVQARIEAKIDRLGFLLHRFPHVRMTGMDCYRIRIGDYRVLYDFDISEETLLLLAVGHRREVYRR